MEQIAGCHPWSFTRPFQPMQTAYGWIVVDANKKQAEQHTKMGNVPYYRTKERAQKKADSLNKK